MLEPIPWRALVLCGGESRRMGEEKGLKAIADQPAVLRLLGVLHAMRRHEGLSQKEPAIVSLRSGQLESYRDVLPRDCEIVIDDEELPDVGPRRGIVTASARHPDTWLLVVAADLPQLTPPVLANPLIRSMRVRDRMGIYAWHSSGHLQTLCAMYGPGALECLRKSPERSLIRSIQLSGLPTYLRQANERQQAALRNANHPWEWPRQKNR